MSISPSVFGLTYCFNDFVNSATSIGSAPSLQNQSLTWVECDNGNVFLAAYNKSPDVSTLYQVNCDTGALTPTDTFQSDTSGQTSTFSIVAWLKCNGKVFLAAPDSGSGFVYLYALDCTTGALTVQDTITGLAGNGPLSLAWTDQCNGKVFLAVNNYNDVSSLSSAVEWIQCSNGNIFLVETGHQILIFALDCDYGTLAQTYASSNLSFVYAPQSDFFVKCDNGNVFFASPQNDTTPGTLSLYQLDCVAGTLTYLQDIDTYSNSNQAAIFSWLKCNGKVFLVESGDLGTVVWALDCDAGTMSQTATLDATANGYTKLQWLACSNGNVFLAGSGPVSGNTSLWELDCQNNTVNSLGQLDANAATNLAWFQCSNGNVFLAEGGIAPNNSLLYSSSCLCPLPTPSASVCFCNIFNSACARGSIALATQLYVNATDLNRTCICNADPLCVAQVLINAAASLVEPARLLPELCCTLFVDETVNLLTVLFSTTTDQNLIARLTREVADQGCCDVLAQTLTALVRTSSNNVTTFCTILDNLEPYCTFCDVVANWFMQMLTSPTIGQDSASTLLAGLLANSYCVAGQNVLACLCCSFTEATNGVDAAPLIADAMVKLQSLYNTTTTLNTCA